MKTLDRLRVWVRRRRDPDAPADCAEVALTLQSYLDERLDEATARRIEAHLDACRACGLEAETYEALHESLRRRGAPPDDVLRRLERFAERIATGDDPDAGPVEHD